MGSVHRVILAVTLTLFLSLNPNEAQENEGNANNFVDGMLKNVKDDPEFRKSMDPASVPEIVEGNLKLTNGEIRGLSHVYRSSDATLSYDEETELIHVTTGLAIRNIRFNSDYRYKVLLIPVSGELEATIDHIDVYLSIKAQTDGKGHLEEFRIVDFSGIHVKKITGMSVILNWALRHLVNLIIHLMKGSIKKSIEKQASKYISEALKNFTFDV